MIRFITDFSGIITEILKTLKAEQAKYRMPVNFRMFR